MAIDIVKIGDPRNCVLLGIDYYTRYLYGTILKSRSSKEIIETMESWFRGSEVPEEIVSDNTKEFVSEEFRKWCNDNQITQKKISQNLIRNGRIIRSIRESVVKI